LRRFRTGSLVFLLFLLPVLLAGCNNPPLAEMPQDPLSGFVATLANESGTQVVIRLEDASMVADADLKKRPAYRLTLDWTVPGSDPISEAYWLDGDLHVVRGQSLCEGPCERIRIDWMSQGTLPPFALGLPHQVQDGHVRVMQGGSWQQVDVAGDDGYNLSDIEYPSGRFLGLANGTAVFSSNPLVPDEVVVASRVIKNGSGLFRLTDLELNKPLTPIPAWPKPEAPPLEPITWSMDEIPAMDWDPFDRGFTLGRAFEELQNDEESAEDLADEDGCIPMFFAMKPYTSVYATAGIAPITNTSDTYFIISDNEGQEADWIVGVDHLAGRVPYQWYVHLAGEKERAAGSCDRMAKDLARPALTLPRFFDRALKESPMPWDTVAWVALPHIFEDRAESHGTIVYVVAGLPPGSSGFSPYNQIMRASTGLWDSMQLTPDALEQLDAPT